MLRAIGELNDIFAILDRAEFENVRQADNSRAMNTNKAAWIQPLFKGLHGFPQEMSPRPGMQFRIISCGGNPFDIVGGDDLNARASPDSEARGVVAWLCLLRAE